MKKYIVWMASLVIAISSMGQKTDSVSVTGLLPEKMATRMKDSLYLSEKEQAAVYEINAMLNQQGLMVWKLYSRRDIVQRELQRIENTRDSLYGLVLPPEKYAVYKKKKVNLINNN